MQPIRLCVAGADGRMGSTIIKEAEKKGMKITGAIAADWSENIGKSIKDAGIGLSDASINPPEHLSKLIGNADIFVSFASPEAEVANIPVVAGAGKGIVCGTTGITQEQMEKIRGGVEGKVCAVFAPNFSIGVNILCRMLKLASLFPKGYDVSVWEAHHAGKVDAPSGTAKKIADIVCDARGYKKVVDRREGKRKEGELEVVAMRAGGIPGIHEVLIAGEHEVLRLEHTAFSRNVFASGAMEAVGWVHRMQREGRTGVFSMDDVLNMESLPFRAGRRSV